MNQEPIQPYPFAARLERALPEVLLTAGEGKTATAAKWRQFIRPQIVDLFREHIYGRETVQRPESLAFQTVATVGMMDGRAVRKQVNITYEGPGGQGAIRLLLFVPTGLERPVPAMLLLNNRGVRQMDPERAIRSPFWPAERIVSRGYAAAVIDNDDAAPDCDDGFRNGVHGIFDRFPDRRPPDAWGTIAAWAWGASRVMDYLETDPDIDAAKTAVVGHSRSGKAALWAGAVDERFAMIVSNNSGSTGAAVARGKSGETIKDINDRFPHWFNENYKAFNGREAELPVDQHMLLSLIAPRLLYVASATEDEWADPVSEFLALVHAGPAYLLFGQEALGIERFPPPDTPIAAGRMGYHLRTGGHDLTEYDWDRFMDFANRYFKIGDLR
jgi:hypothetical protein